MTLLLQIFWQTLLFRWHRSFRHVCKKDGVFITSGIIDFKENEVKEAIEKAGMTVLEVTHQGEWVSITARK